MLAGTALITYSGCVHPRESERGYYAFGSDRRVVGTPATDHRFTGQKVDGSGLYYYNARYYDPVIGQFVSPDTIVPEPGRVFAYNRYMYVMGNPLRFSDPSGHYSNDEIMQHYGCNDWACVESHYQAGGSHEGLWGWLYILQQAQDGDGVSSSTGSFYGAMNGRFQRNQAGQIQLIHASGLTLHERGAAQFAGFGAWGGSYTLESVAQGKLTTSIYRKHRYLHYDSSQIDKGEIVLGAMAAGTDFGPMLMARAKESGHPLAGGTMFVGGLSYTFVGLATMLTVDVIQPISEAANGNVTPGLESAAVEYGSRRLANASELGANAAPYVGPGYSMLKGASAGICYDTGCPR